MTQISNQIIQCPPASGKTYLVARNPGAYIDSDALLSAVMGVKSSKATYDALRKRPSAVALLRHLMVEASKKAVVLTNFTLPGLPITAMYGYTPDDYIEHIRIANRTGLLEKFSEDELRSWMRNYAARYDDVHLLKAGEFIAGRV